MIKRLLIGCLAALCTLGVLFGCTGRQASPDKSVRVVSGLDTAHPLVGNLPCAFPLAEDGASLNIMITGYGSVPPEDVYVFRKYGEMTGVSVNWTVLQKSARTEAVNSALINSTSLDLIMRCKIDPALIAQYGSAGLLLDLGKDGLLARYAPNCWAYLQSHPDALASVQNPDGTIYSLPQINAGAELRVSRKLFINKQWLENLGLGIPHTTDELYDLLKAFYVQDANGNGDPRDEIPLSPIDWTSLKESLFGAFGLGNRGLHNLIVDYDEQTGGVRLIAASEEYRQFTDYCRRLYAEGLLDEHVFSVSTDLWRNQSETDRIGVFAATNLASIPADQADNWVAVEDALTGPCGGAPLWSAIRANFHSAGAAVLPATCRDPALVLRWLDYFWTDEGTLFYHMGVEGKTFFRTDDGSFDYMPYIYEEMASGNLPFDDVIARYSPYPGGSNPTVEIAPYFRGGETAAVPAAAARSLIEYGPSEYWPSFTFTPEESDELAVIQNDLTKYCASALKDFVKGIRPMSDWDAYLVQLDRLQMGKLTEIYAAAVGRYEKAAAKK